VLYAHAFRNQRRGDKEWTIHNEWAGTVYAAVDRPDPLRADPRYEMRVLEYVLYEEMAPESDRVTRQRDALLAAAKAYVDAANRFATVRSQTEVEALCDLADAVAACEE
jgi:hypothetical protein